MKYKTLLLILSFLLTTGCSTQNIKDSFLDKYHNTQCYSYKGIYRPNERDNPFTLETSTSLEISDRSFNKLKSKFIDGDELYISNGPPITSAILVRNGCIVESSLIRWEHPIQTYDYIYCDGLTTKQFLAKEAKKRSTNRYISIGCKFKDQPITYISCDGLTDYQINEKRYELLSSEDIQIAYSDVKCK